MESITVSTFNEEVVEIGRYKFTVRQRAQKCSDPCKKGKRCHGFYDKILYFRVKSPEKDGVKSEKGSQRMNVRKST